MRLQTPPRWGRMTLEGTSVLVCVIGLRTTPACRLSICTQIISLAHLSSSPKTLAQTTVFTASMRICKATYAGAGGRCRIGGGELAAG